MRSEKGRRKKMGAYFFSVSIHIVLILLLAFPFLKNDQSDEQLFNGLLIQFDSHNSSLPNRTVPKRQKPKNVSNNPIEEAAETKVLKPKLEKSRKVKPIPESKSTKIGTKAETKNLETHTTLTEKRRDFLVKNVLKAEKQQKEDELKANHRAELEELAKIKRYEKTKNAFSQLLKNANHETSDNSTDIELYDESLDESSEPTQGRDDQSISNRKVIFIPQINDDSQKEGRVVIKICVNADGLVTSSRYTQLGSTTTDQYLIDLALKNAKLYRFSSSDYEKQCGKVNIDFEVR